jgi:hypothetical protein
MPTRSCLANRTLRCADPKDNGLRDRSIASIAVVQEPRAAEPYLKPQGRPALGSFSSCTIRFTEGWLPTVPDRCPFRPRASGLQFWSPPNDSSPGPISTRLPSIVSTNQRPESGTIHWGFGFSCHSPTQPTGWTTITTVVPGALCLSSHEGAAPGEMLWSLKALSSQRFWWLTQLPQR